jgi:tRNA A37 threonylcarbamoyladenosine dehydratase
MLWITPICTVKSHILTSDEGRPKVESLRDTILGGNPNIEVEIHNIRLERDNVA